MDTPQQGDQPQQPVPAQAVPESPPQPPRSRRSCLPVMLVLLGLGLMLSMFLNLILAGAAASLANIESESKVIEEHVSHNRKAKNKVAVITISGTIMDTEGYVKQQIDRVKKDENVRAVVLRIDSPGGSVTGSDYFYHHLTKLSEENEIPIVASFGGLAASGGYYVAMSVGDTPNSIYAEPTTWTGSIGVVIPHYDLSELLTEKWGVKEDSIASKPLKTMGSFAREMTEEERAIFKALVDDGFERFKDVIKSGRPAFAKDPAALDKLATGQIYTADQAKDGGLVDRIGFIEDAIDRAIELTGLSPKDVEVVRYRRQPTLASALLGSEARSSQPDLSALLDMTAPRAYYLYTWMPGLNFEKGEEE